MKKSFYLLSILFVTLFSFSTSELTAQAPCGHDYFTNYYKSLDPNFVQSVLHREGVISNYINNNLGSSGYVESTNPIANTQYVIQVMVHIIEDPSSTNPSVSYAQVESQIDALNTHYNVSSNPIQFCLKKQNLRMYQVQIGI
jgi:hypothetical protein